MHITVYYIIACALVGAMGRSHRWLGFWGVFALSLLLTPLFGLLLVAFFRGGERPVTNNTDDVDQ